jgi:DNA replication and repair protein RecF
VILERLVLRNFKNYSEAIFSFNRRVVCITGPNGVGKTNLLDAISYTCWGKSYFQSTDKHCLKKGYDFFRIQAKLLGEERHDLVIKYRPDGGKQMSWDDNNYDRLSDHIGKIPLVVVAPDDIIEFLSGSKERRRFMDFTLSQYDRKYLRSLMEYNRLLKQRNAHLKSWDRPESVNKTLLNTLGHQMKAPAHYIFEARRDFMASFGPEVNENHHQLSGRRESISCLYQSPLLKRDFIELLEQNYEKDVILQRTTQGIHKDDMKVLIDGAPLKIHASQGQKKSFILSLKTAQFQWLFQHLEKKPVLLLDDFFEKLDQDRLSSLMKMIVGMDFGQIFLTDTEQKRVEHLFQLTDIEYQSIQIQATDNELEEE